MTGLAVENDLRLSYARPLRPVASARQSCESEMTSVGDVPTIAAVPTAAAAADQASPSLPPSPPGSSHGKKSLDQWATPRALSAARIEPAPHVV